MSPIRTTTFWNPSYKSGPSNNEQLMYWKASLRYNCTQNGTTCSKPYIPCNEWLTFLSCWLHAVRSLAYIQFTYRFNKSAAATWNRGGIHSILQTNTMLRFCVRMLICFSHDKELFSCSRRQLLSLLPLLMSFVHSSFLTSPVLGHTLYDVSSLQPNYATFINPRLTSPQGTDVLELPSLK